MSRSRFALLCLGALAWAPAPALAATPAQTAEPIKGYLDAADGVTLPYLELGAGPPVVLLHDHGGDPRDLWFATGVAQELARTHRVLALAPKLADDLVVLLDRLKIERAHVHGWSMGGSIVTDLLDRHPGRLLTASYGGSGIADGDRIDLRRVSVPVLAINGALDQPSQKIARMKRELETFWSYVLPDRDHQGTVGVEYTKILGSFLHLYDPGTPAPEHGWFTASDGVKLHYWALGSGGSPVVLLHGFSGSADMWLMNGVAAALRDRHRVLALDCRGHGLSDKPHDPMKYGLQIADDIVELLDHEGYERAHVHGFSLGGWILARLLARHPERVATAAFVGHAQTEIDPEMAARVPPDYPGVDSLDPESREAVRAPIEIESRQVKGPSTRDDEALAAARAYPWKPGEKGVESEVFPSRLPIDLTKVDIPVLAIMGELDFPNYKTHRMWRELDDFQMVRLPGRGHTSGVAPGYIPAEYVPATVRFIDGNDFPVARKPTAAPSASAH